MKESDREKLQRLTVEVILELRRAYLASGASPLKHWEQLQDRVRMAAKTSASVADWVTNVSRNLGLGSPSNSLSSAIKLLELGVQETCYPEEWLDLVEDEYTFLIALCRLEVARRKQQPGPTEDELMEKAVGKV